MTHDTLTVTESINAWLAVLPRLREWNERAHASREAWHLVLNDSVVGCSPIKLRDLRRQPVLDAIKGALGASSVTYKPQEYVASGRGAFGRLGGSGLRSRTSPARLRIVY